MRMFCDDVGNVLITLRDVVAASKESAEVILDLSTMGNWIRGFEMVGGMFNFSLRQAVKPFNPRAPVPGEVTAEDKLKVTYDEEADAAYFYLPYGSRFRTLSSVERAKMTEYSHSINPTAMCILDANGGLVSVLVPTADAVGSLEGFLYLYDVVRQPSVS